MTLDTEAQILEAFGKFATRPAGWGYLGDGSGQIVADTANRLVWYRVAKGQPAVTAKLAQSINILAINRAGLDGMRVDLGYPPSQTVLHVLKIDDGEGMASVGGLTVEEQYNAASKFSDVGSILNFRVSPNNPIDNEVYIGPGAYISSTGEWRWWGGDSTVDLLTTAIAALGADEHQMAVVCFNTSTGEPAIVTNTAEAGGINDKTLFDTTTIQEMTIPDHYLLCGAVHLYTDRTENTEDDMYRSSDPRPIFKATGSDGIANVTSPDGTIDIDDSTPGTVAIDVADGAIDADKLAANAVTQSKILDGAVTTSKINDTAVTADKLASNAVTTAKVANLAITDAKINDVAASKVTGVLGVDHGGSGADMSATGGANYLVKQLTPGGAFTAALLALADIPNALITGAKIALATIGLTNLANGTPFRYMGWDSTGAAAELDGAVDTTGTAGEAWSARDKIYLDSSVNKWFKIDINAVPIKIGPVRGAALAAATLNSTGNRIRRKGIVTGYSLLTPGAALYADFTAGGYTQTKPSVDAGSGQVVICEMGYAIDATTAFIDTGIAVEYLKREILEDGDTIEITHHSDPEGRTRGIEAYITSNTEVIKEQYTSSDTDAPLKRRSTGSTVTVDAAGASPTALGDTGGTDIRMAQQFEVATTGYVSTIAFNTGATTGAPSAFPSYRIEGNNAISTTPNGNVVANSSGTHASWTASGTVTITYPAPGPYLVAGVKYWFIEELPLQANNNFYTIIRNTGGGYGAGVMKWDSTTGASFPDTWANGGGTNDMRVAISTVVVNDALAQQMTLSSAIDVTRVQLYLKRTGTLTGVDLSVVLYQGNGTIPLAPLYGSNVVAASTVGTSAAYVEFTFSTPAALSTGDWHIALVSTGAGSATAYIDWLVDTSSPGYSGGVLTTLRNTTWAAASPAADGQFILYGVDTYFDEQVVVGLGSAVMKSHTGDASYANQNTITTFENVSGVVYGTLIDATGRVRMR